MMLADGVLPERFLAHIEVTPTGCWEWTGTPGRGGYMRVKVDGSSPMAHRAVYELLVGSIPDGLVVDHLCRNRACVNPDHLEPVTQQVNILRGVGASAQHVLKTHCPQGHPYDEANTYVLPSRPTARYCRTCMNGRVRKRGHPAGALDTDDERHGTLTGYTYWRCRCPLCQSAMSDYRQSQPDRRDRRRRTPRRVKATETTDP